MANQLMIGQMTRPQQQTQVTQPQSQDSDANHGPGSRKDQTGYEYGGGIAYRNDDGTFTQVGGNAILSGDSQGVFGTNYQGFLGQYNQAQQYRQAKDFRNNIPNYENQMYNSAQSQTYSDAANARNQVKSNANSRGLLYSGMEQGAEAGVNANAASNLAQERSGINAFTEDYANKLDQGAQGTGLQDYESQVQASMAAYQNQLQQQAQARGQIGQFLQGAGSIGALAFLSDKNEKKNIESSDSDIEDFLSKVPNKKYDYKDPKNGTGKHFGFLAQDLEKHPIGKSMVEEHNGKKMVNMAKGLGTILSIQSYLNNKMNSIKGGK